MKLSNGEPGQFLDGRPEAFCMIASKGSLPFLPAAKPTGLVELNVLLSSFFFLNKNSKEGQNSPNKHGSICSLGYKFKI